jgi:hypothetical protein
MFPKIRSLDCDPSVICSLSGGRYRNIVTMAAYGEDDFKAMTDNNVWLGNM